MSMHTFSFNKGLNLLPKMLNFQCNYHVVDCHTYISAKILQKSHFLAKCMSMNTSKFHKGLRFLYQLFKIVKIGTMYHTGDCDK